MDLTRLEINRRTALLTSAAIAANVINPMRAFAQETPHLDPFLRAPDRSG
jgi:peptide/nickel transport system substrate-binding protein